jgi:hypothetical protein
VRKIGVESLSIAMIGNGTKNISKMNLMKFFLEGARLVSVFRGGFGLYLNTLMYFRIDGRCSLKPLLIEEEFERKTNSDGLKTLKKKRDVDVFANRICFAYGKITPYGGLPLKKR